MHKGGTEFPQASKPSRTNYITESPHHPPAGTAETLAFRQPDPRPPAESPSSLLRVPPKRSCLLDSHHTHTATDLVCGRLGAASWVVLAGPPKRAAVAARAGPLEED